MFISNVSRKEEVRELAIKHLRQHGIKYKQKKRPHHQQVNSYKNKSFGVSLAQLKTEIVTLANGQQLVVPKIVCDMTQFIIKKDPEREGLFRLSGRLDTIQKIKVELEKGHEIPSEENVINVAALLKRFFKDLPESLIPATHQDLFFHCMGHSNQVELIFLACLLLPSEHINVLAYIMTFLHEISTYSNSNKMDSYNLAVCFGPSLIPIEEKTANQSTINKIIELIQLMIVNSNSLGMIPEDIINETGQQMNENPKKRRSGSLTRMFSGLRKIVGKSDIPSDGVTIVTPDLLLTPSINRTERGRSKKRRTDLFAKKKKEIIDRMPQARLMSTPYTPISSNPNPKKPLSSHQSLEDIINHAGEKEKKSQWYNRSKSVKNLKEEEEMEFKEKRRNSLGPRAMLERRWSQVSQVANFRKKKRNSCVTLRSQKEEQQDKRKIEVEEPDYVRVSKEEYEEIKSRVSEIERRISMELEKEQNSQKIENVINAYEQTLEQSQPMSPTTDHLARRLSKELRIRKNSDSKVIRSPSARKIGSIRRRSRERVARHQSLHVPNTVTVIPRAHLAKPPTRRTSGEQRINRPVTRSTSFQGPFHTPPPCNSSNDSNGQWINGESFFATLKTPKDDSVGSANGRASIAKIRSQNAGMVLAKAKLFDNLQDSDSSCNTSTKSTTTTIGNKIGEARMSQRVRNLRTEERKVKKSTSPRRRAANVHRSKIYMSKEQVQAEYKKSNLADKTFTSPLKEVNRNSPKSTPKSIPHIKKSLHVRSPKRLCKTPLSVDKRTPMKVLLKNKCQF